MASSPFPEGVKNVRLEVHPGNELAEVFVIDHAWELVERSIGDLTADVEPGVYKVKARLGEATTEQLIVMTEDREINLSSELDLTSPAPVWGTSQTHEYHVDAAATFSSGVGVDVGSGATIFLMTRRYTREGRHPEPNATPPSELTLHAPDGSLLADLRGQGQGVTDVIDGVLGVTVAVDPGGYILRWSGAGDIAVEQSVHAVRDWQTQVFLLEEARHKGRHRVSIQMSKSPFDPNDSERRMVEAVRSALADERRVASEQINEALLAKFRDPMLGLMGAHLMLIAARALEDAQEAQRRGARGRRAPVAFNQKLFDHVVGNLRGLLGSDHPDVVALSTRASDGTLEGLAPVTAPPTFWRSWVLLIEASNRVPGLLPPTTWWRTVRQLALRPFLVWSPDPNPGATARAWGTTVRESLAVTDGPDARERLSGELLAPRAVIDELADQV